MEAFSDGVFSIAATLLVLDIALEPPGTPLEQVLHAWPAYLGYVISFLTIGAAWLGHSAMTDRMTRADSLFLRINLLLLLVIAFLPFPTNLIVDAIGDDANGERCLERHVSLAFSCQLSALSLAVSFQLSALSGGSV